MNDNCRQMLHEIAIANMCIPVKAATVFDNSICFNLSHPFYSRGHGLTINIYEKENNSKYHNIFLTRIVIRIASKYITGTYL